MANTTNSLSDLNNNGYKFNRLLTSEQINDTYSLQSQIEKTKNERTALEAQLIGANSAKKQNINRRINSSNQKLNELESKLNNVANNIGDYGNIGNSSIFDRDALIDFGRFINNDGSIKPNWIEYNLKDKTVVNSESNPFILNNTSPINTPVLYNDSSINNIDGLSVPNLVKWSEKYPALQLRNQDFVFCKKLGYYSNNKLIILRRFKGGVPDNLFDYHNPSQKVEFTQPLSTMITWLNPDDNIIDMKFNEEWEVNKQGFVEVLKNSINDFQSSKTSDNKETNISGFSDMITSLAFDKFLGQKQDGTKFTRSISGNPNLIKQAQKRTTGGEGLNSEITFTLSFEYEMRFINGIDPSIVMLDLMSNAMRMGTSESEFRYQFEIPDKIKSFINGDSSNAFNIFSESIKVLYADLQKFTTDTMNDISEFFNDPIGNLNKIINESANSTVDYIFSRYREALKSALSVDTGVESGIWHVQIGNPKAPIISCGDLIIKSSKLSLGNEFGYNDFPNSFKVEYTLTSARPRGRQELSRIFNSGRGRYYVYPNAKQNPDFDQYEPIITKSK